MDNQFEGQKLIVIVGSSGMGRDSAMNIADGGQN
jgi:hypothetical protein